MNADEEGPQIAPYRAVLITQIKRGAAKDGEGLNHNIILRDKETVALCAVAFCYGSLCRAALM